MSDTRGADHPWSARATVAVDADEAEQALATGTFTVTADTLVPVNEVFCRACGGGYDDVVTEPCLGPVSAG